MALTAGTRFGSYEVTEPIGAGGMGEVWRATDTNLKRDVALKVLPEGFATDADRLARFRREAEMLASLNHPNVATIHGLEQSDGQTVIVMELVEGETLEEKLKPGALPVEDALRLALQIAEALEAAHAKGVIHRDLKPANVMITQDGIAKVLDFGLAKAFAVEGDESRAARSPALSAAMTQQGLVLGTAAYMSPEQASGQPTDQRADVWAFGVVLYEMLAGLPPFAGESVPHILADVLRADPDWARLPTNLHPRVRQLLERCLAKKARQRYAGIADARTDIEAALKDPGGVTPAAAASPSSAPRPLPIRLARSLALIGLGAGIAGVVARMLWPGIEHPVFTRTFFGEPPEHPLRVQGFNSDVVITSDGRQIVYRSVVDGDETIIVGDLASSETTPIQTGVIRNLFLSPDDSWIGYYDLALSGFFRVPINDGPAIRIVTTGTAPRGAAWLSNDRIIYGLDGSGGLWLAAVDGGEPVEITTPDAARGELSHEWPFVLPGEEWLLYTVRFENQLPETSEIAARNLITGAEHRVIEGGSDARYLPTGHIVYGFGATLRAVPVDPERLVTTDIGRPVVERLATNDSGVGVANFSVAGNGTMVYAFGGEGAPAVRVVRLAADGSEELLGFEPMMLSSPVLAADGTRLALSARPDARQDWDIWTWSERGTGRQLTFETGNHRAPIFTPDGENVIYWTEGRGLYRRPFDGNAPPELIFETTETIMPIAMTANGLIVVDHQQADYTWDIGILTPGDASGLEPLISGPGSQTRSALSPRGDFLAYQTNESGSNEVHVVTFPNVDAGRWSIPSPTGGREPIWSADGSRIYFLSDGDASLMSAEVTTGPGFSSEAATEVMPIPRIFRLGNSSPSNYDVFPGEGGFLFLKSEIAAVTEAKIVVLTNWFEELERLVPTDRP